jgi:hypothetical protein
VTVDLRVAGISKARIVRSDENFGVGVNSAERYGSARANERTPDAEGSTFTTYIEARMDARVKPFDIHSSQQDSGTTAGAWTMRRL